MLAAQGHFVMLMARNAEEISELEHEIDTTGGKSLSFALDITNEAQVNAAIDEIIRDFGHIDYLINNAGIGTFKPAEEITADEWSRLMDVNVKGSFLLTKAVLPHMKAAGQGHVLAVASDVSKRTFAHGSLYCASKYAQDAFFSALRREVRPFNIKVSVIYPGLVDTYFHPHGEPGQDRNSWYMRGEDIASAISYVLHTPPHVCVDELMLHPMKQEW
jgi:NADP-dependent 3-hydroxy acid dehydrogenase YdfG